MQLKFYRYTFIIYSAVLLLSLGLFYLFPKTVLSEIELDSSGVEDQSDHDAPIDWEREQLGGAKLYHEWHFDYAGACLEVAPADSEEVRVHVKRTEAGTGRIVAEEYRRDSPLSGMMNSYEVDLTGNKLSVKGPQRCELNFKVFTPEFTVVQFREGEREHSQRLHRSFEFFQLFYLYVPGDVELDFEPDGNGHLIIMDEE